MFDRRSLLTESQLHYTATPVSAVTTKYAALCDQVAGEIRSEVLTGPVADMVKPGMPQKAFQHGGLGESERYVGSQLVPRTAAVRRAIKKMRQRLHHERRSATPGWIQRFHNYYTIYTVLLLSWGSGIRTVCFPLPHPRLLDTSNGRFVVSDKDDQFGSQTRIVYVPDMVCRQVESYYAHIARLQVLLAVLDASRAQMLSEHIASFDEIRQDHRRRGRIDERETSPFFLLGKKLNLQPLGPSAVYEWLGDDYPFAANCHRHYLRTHLVLTGTSEHLIDAFMGHAAHGREAFTASSTLALAAYADVLRKALARILDDVGWVHAEGIS